MSATVCSYQGCTNSSSKVKGLQMFRFSKTLTKEWIKNTGNSDLIGASPIKLYTCNRICGNHFRKDDINSSGRLNRNAVPIPFAVEPIPEPSHVQDSIPSLRVNRGDLPPRKYPGKSHQEGRLESPSSLHSPAVSTSSATFRIDNTSPQKHGDFITPDMNPLPTESVTDKCSDSDNAVGARTNIEYPSASVQSALKRKISQKDSVESETLKCLKVFAENISSRDEYLVYGENVAYRLRDCGRSRYEIAIARRRIDEICFQLEMGSFAQHLQSAPSTEDQDPLQTTFTQDHSSNPLNEDIKNHSEIIIKTEVDDESNSSS